MFKEDDLSTLSCPVSDDLTSVNRLILEQFHSQTQLINTIHRYISSAGGKRIRPLLVLLTAQICDYSGRDHITLATAIEFLHTATLLHDDVVDLSAMRRGKKTANNIWGNASSVLVGDFIYSRAFQLMIQLGLDVMKVLSSATNIIAEGEVMQLTQKKNIHLTEKDYFDIIYRKTAMLFEASSHSAAILAKSSVNTIHSLQHYGRYLGMSFQLLDDALDYSGNSKKMGKNIGDDLAEGKITLPLIYLMKTGSTKQIDLISSTIRNPDDELLEKTVQLVRESHAIAYTIEQATKFSHRALQTLEHLPDSPSKHALKQLAHFSFNRNR